jgi:SAM-dependent methyltransferase
MNRASGDADYGIDAPGVIRGLTTGGIFGLFVGGLGLLVGRGSGPLVLVIGAWGVFVAITTLPVAALMYRSSKRGKLRERDKLLDDLQLRGDEVVLDVGPGPGLLLIGAAKRLGQGRAIGVDIWRPQDESDNRPERTMANARAEGVADRIELIHGDAQALPLPDGSVDVVISSLALHNVPSATGRQAAIREIDRVVRSGGRVSILDFQATDEYERSLRGLGWKDVARTARRFAMFPPVRIVTASKP